MSPPRKLYRVEYLEGFGWPDCTRRERTRRTYERVEDARRMVATVRALPSHHQMIAAHEGEVRWQQIPDEWLPNPEDADRPGDVEPAA